jgi:hypothetical protein
MPFAQQIQTIAPRADGRIYVGGSLTVSNRQNIVRLESGGAVDLSFNANASSSSPTRMLVTADGGVLVGGNFMTINGVSSLNFARLAADGSTINWAAGAPNSSVNAMVLQPNGRLVLSGGFNSVGTSRNQLARFEADGSLDATFNPGTSFGGSAPSALALESDGSIWVGGSFTTYGGTTVNRLVLLTGDPAGVGGGGNQSPYDTWAASFGLTSLNKAPDFDADFDGLPNIFEFYSGTQPLNVASALRPVATWVTVSATVYPAVKFTRSTAATGVTLAVTASGSVLFGDSLGTTPYSTTDLGNGTEEIIIRSNVSAAVQPTQFFELRLSVP